MKCYIPAIYILLTDGKQQQYTAVTNMKHVCIYNLSSVLFSPILPL